MEDHVFQYSNIIIFINLKKSILLNAMSILLFDTFFIRECPRIFLGEMGGSCHGSGGSNGVGKRADVASSLAGKQTDERDQRRLSEIRRPVRAFAELWIVVRHVTIRSLPFRAHPETSGTGYLLSRRRGLDKTRR